MLAIHRSTRPVTREMSEGPSWRPRENCTKQVDLLLAEPSSYAESIADEDNLMGFGSKMAAEHRKEVGTLSRERHDKVWPVQTSHKRREAHHKRGVERETERVLKDSLWVLIGHCIGRLRLAGNTIDHNWGVLVTVNRIFWKDHTNEGFTG